MSRGGARKGAGAPKKAPGQKKVSVSYRISPWIVRWLRDQPESSTELIERALTRYYLIEQPGERNEDIAAEVAQDARSIVASLTEYGVTKRVATAVVEAITKKQASIINMHIEEIKTQHKMWLEDHETGKRADFSGRKLDLVDFNNASLRDAIFSGADITSSSFVNADLRGAIFTGATCYSADFSQANMLGAKVDKAKFHNAIFREAELINADLSFSDFLCCKFENAIMLGAKTEKTVFPLSLIHI